MCPSVPQRPERSAVRYRPIAAPNCIFIAIIDYLNLWSEEEMILFNKAQLGSHQKAIKRTNFIVGTVYSRVLHDFVIVPAQTGSICVRAIPESP